MEAFKNIPSLDELFEDTSKEQKANKLLKQQTNGSSVVEKKINLAGNATNALRRSATEKLNHYIQTSPQYKVLKQQMDVLKQQMIEYKKLGAIEHYETLKEQLMLLKGSVKKFENIVKTETNASRNAKYDAVKASPKLKELKNTLDSLKDEYSKKNINSIMSKLMDIRQKLEAKSKHQRIQSIDEALEDSVSEVSSTEAVYEEILFNISELTDIPVSELEHLSNNEILKELRASQTESDKQYIEELKTKIESVKMDASSEMKRVKGYHDITDVIFNTFDFETEEERPKDMLASANVKYVQAIAYNICSKQSMLRNYEDAVSYGLLGLTLAINKWYGIQKLKDSALSFEGFAHVYIVNSIKRGLYELSSGGMISGSARANLEHKRNKNIEYWLKHNQELKDIPTEYIEDIVDGMGYSKVNTPTTETDYNTIVGGEQSYADIWSRNIANGFGDGNSDTLAETKLNYEDLVNSLKSLFLMFDTKVDKETGIKKITNKKLFDKYDYQLFLMNFGLKTKYDSTTGKQRNYNQTEMAEELSKFYAANGIRKTFSQPAINARIKTIMSKINNVMKLYPEIRKGFEYLLYNITANSGNYANISSNREEYGINYNLETNNKNKKPQQGITSKYGSEAFTLGGANVTFK